MRKLLGVLAAAAVVVSLALPAVAQEVVSAKASRVTIGGYIDFDAVLREADIFPIGPQDEAFVNTDLSIELTIDMTDNVSAFIQIRDDWVDEAEFSDVGTYYGFPLPGVVEPANPWSGDDYNLEIEQAYIDVREFLVPELDLRIGIQNLAWDLRGNGDEFLLNVNENHDFGAPLEAGAWKATYDADPLTIEAFAATLGESLGLREDAALYGGLATYPFDDMSKGQLGLFVLDVDSVQMYALDVGVDYWLNEDTEIYGEAAFNFGDWDDEDTDAKGWGGYAGGMYTFSDVEWTPSIDLSYWHLSGDGDPFDTDVESFLSLEDVDTFAIIEENHYGWDLDSNYTAVKACASAQPTDDVTVELKVGWFQLDEKYDFVGLEEDDVGTEVDASVTWQYSENLAFTGLFAYLFGSDLAEEALVERYGKDPEDVDDSGFLAALQTKLIF